MTLKTSIKKTYAKLTSEETKANLKKGLSKSGEVLKKIGASVGKAKNAYLEHDKEQGGGLGLFK
jgi:hypothetical protein